MHQAWGPKASTPNASLEIRETAVSGARHQFRLFATGLPADGVYSIVTWPVTQKGPSEILKGVTLGDSGVAVCAGAPGRCGSADKPNDPIDIVLQPIPGEPSRLGLVSADRMTKVFARIVPVPVKGEDRGCGAEAILLTPRGELVLIEGSGFPPNSNVGIDSDSAGERHNGTEKTDADGRMTSAFLPNKQGVAGGTLKVILKSAQCSPAVSIAWGQHK
jgi:hypothetical protein